MGPAEQQKLLERFFRREYALLTQLLAPAPQGDEDDEDYEEVGLRWDDEGGTVPRETYWTQIKEYRAKRGELAELSSDEKQLSPEDCLALWGREERLWREEEHRRELVRVAKLGRLLGVVLASVGISAMALQYLDYLPDKLLRHSRDEQRVFYLMMTVIGAVIAFLSHFDLRARVLRTAGAEKQAKVAKWTVGTAFFFLCFALLALVWSVFIAVALQWMADKIPILRTAADAAQRELGFAIVVAAIVLVMTVTSLGAFYFLRRHEELELALPAAAWAGLSPFFVIAIVAFKLFILAMVIGLIASAMGFPSFEGSIDNNLALVMGLAAATMVVAIAVKYVHGRYRAPNWEDWRMTLSTAAFLVVMGFPALAGIGVLLVFAAIAGVKAVVLG